MHILLLESVIPLAKSSVNHLIWSSICTSSVDKRCYWDLPTKVSVQNLENNGSSLQRAYKIVGSGPHKYLKIHQSLQLRNRWIVYQNIPLNTLLEKNLLYCNGSKVNKIIQLPICLNSMYLFVWVKIFFNILFYSSNHPNSSNCL